MKKGSELVWSMCECESRIVCTATCCCTVSTCDSDPASSAIEPFKRRQVILHSRLSPPNPPSTLRRIVALQCTAQGDDVTRKGRGPPGTRQSRQTKLPPYGCSARKQHGLASHGPDVQAGVPADWR